MHRQPERVNPPSVYVRGEVGRPGRYPLASDMRVSDLVRSAGGFLRSANPESADLVHYAVLEGAASTPVGRANREFDERAESAKRAANVLLNDGDVLTVPQQTRWKDMGATVTLHGEVLKPGVYGIEPGERLSSLLRRAGGLLPSAYPQAAVFERIEVRKMQERSRQELIQRLEQESTVVKTAITTSGSEEAALQQAAVQQRQRVVEGLRRAPVSGRLVVHIRGRPERFSGIFGRHRIARGRFSGYSQAAWIRFDCGPGLQLECHHVHAWKKHGVVFVSRRRRHGAGQQKSNFHYSRKRFGD